MGAITLILYPLSYVFHESLIFWQAYSPALPVGAQHYYRSSWDALTTIWRKERLRGMLRGIDAAALRTGMGSSVRLYQSPHTQELHPHNINRFNYPLTTGQNPSLSKMDGERRIIPLRFLPAPPFQGHVSYVAFPFRYPVSATVFPCCYYFVHHQSCHDFFFALVSRYAAC